MANEVEHLYRGIEIKPLNPEHICYKVCGDRWCFVNEKIKMLYTFRTIIECCQYIEYLAGAGLIDCLPLATVTPDYEYLNY